MFNKFSEFVTKHKIALKYIGCSIAAIGTGGIASTNLWLRWKEHKNSIEIKIDKSETQELLVDAKIEALQNKLKMEQQQQCMKMLKDLHDVYSNNVHLFIHLHINPEHPQNLFIEAINQQNNELLGAHDINLQGE